MRSPGVRQRSASRRDEGHPCHWSVREARHEGKTRPTIVAARDRVRGGRQAGTAVGAHRPLLSQQA